jgi:hypothetical protein
MLQDLPQCHTVPARQYYQSAWLVLSGPSRRTEIGRFYRRPSSRPGQKTPHMCPDRKRKLLTSDGAAQSKARLSFSAGAKAFLTHLQPLSAPAAHGPHCPGGVATGQNVSAPSARVLSSRTPRGTVRSCPRSRSLAVNLVPGLVSDLQHFLPEAARVDLTSAIFSEIPEVAEECVNDFRDGSGVAGHPTEEAGVGTLTKGV